jgi:hypothetical protein
VNALRAAALVLAMPVSAFAQASIAGEVTDATGGVLPGVTVQVSSPALIEKTRTAVTDRSGRYRIEDLRPGTYAVRFTLRGWAPRERDDIELVGSFSASLDMQLSPVAVAETVTVKGQPPLDVYNARHEVVVDADLVKALPTARGYNALLPLIPGVLTNVNDTITATATASFPIHGGRTNEGRLTVDGLPIGSPPNGNSAASYVIDAGLAQEVTFTTTAATGETETAGLVMNVISRSGGNQTRGSIYAAGTGRALQFNNLTSELVTRGAMAPTPLSKLYDISGTAGGPLRRDRAWYVVTGHTGASTRYTGDVYYNENAGDATKWLYAPDFSRQEYSDRTYENASARVTVQLTPRNKVTAFWDAQSLCRRCTGATPGLSEPPRIAPEAVGVLGRPLHVTQATWASTLTTKLALDAGYSGTYFGVGNFERDPNPTRDLVRVVEQCASGCAANGNISGLVYRSQDYSVAHAGSYQWRGSLSYVTGSHSVKIGYQHTLMTDDRSWLTNTRNLTYRFNNGVPNQLTQSISPWQNDARVGWDAVFAQEQWTRDRLTVQAALRFDRAGSWFPEQQEGPSRFLPQAIRIPRTRGVNAYTDISPRFGASYDLTGSGKTVLRGNLGKYLEGAGVTGTYANTNPTLRMPQTTSVFGTAGVTRAWIDANTNFTPDCDLLNPLAQDLRAVGGDLCGVMSNTSFGQYVMSSNFDPRVLSGWGIRPADWSLGISIDHELLPRTFLNVAYNRRWFSGFTVVDNLAVTPADLTPFSIVAPADPRLPGGGGYTVSGLYDVVPEKAGNVDNFVTSADTFGRWSQSYNGLDVSVSVRQRRLSVEAGTSTGQSVADNCDVRARLPELSTATMGTAVFGPGLANSAVTPLSPYCHVGFGVMTQFRGLSSYLFPRVDVQLSATFQSKPGPMLAANYTVPNAVVAPSLGRSLSGDAANVTVNLVEPGTMYGDRINQLDLRVAKGFRPGRSRLTVAAEVYNALNSSAVLTVNPAFVPGGRWLQPLTILTPRFIKFTAEVEF